MANLKLNLPNALTLFRIFLTPLFVIFMLEHQKGLSLLIFVLAAVSDALDGLLARLLNQRTVLGSYLDPIADKLLLMSAFVCLGILEMLPVWLPVVVISRDILIILGLLLFTFESVPFEIRPSGISKITTFLQLMTVLLVLLEDRISLHHVLPALYWTTALFTLASGVHYSYRGLKIYQQASENR